MDAGRRLPAAALGRRKGPHAEPPVSSSDRWIISADLAWCGSC